jgi:DHA1 family inner membrane transport protein
VTDVTRLSPIALGLFGVGMAIGAGLGLLSAAWAGLGLTGLGLLIFGLPLRQALKTAPT